MSAAVAKSKRLLLISNSTLFGGGYLDHAEPEIRELMDGTSKILFVPFALHDKDQYADQARTRFERMGYALQSIHEALNKKKAVEEAEAVFIGGGNTFRLLNALYEFDLLAPLRQKVAEGMLYIGSSAGSNVAGLTIKTTNDMPIVQPPSFIALGLVTFQINPHYLDPDPESHHMGETREERIKQFLEDNETPVIGLREGTMLRIESGAAILKGTSTARIFRRGEEPLEASPGARVDQLLES